MVAMWTPGCIAVRWIWWRKWPVCHTVPPTGYFSILSLIIMPQIRTHMAAADSLTPDPTSDLDSCPVHDTSSWCDVTYSLTRHGESSGQFVALNINKLLRLSKSSNARNSKLNVTTLTTVILSHSKMWNMWENKNNELTEVRTRTRTRGETSGLCAIKRFKVFTSWPNEHRCKSPVTLYVFTAHIPSKAQHCLMTVIVFRGDLYQTVACILYGV